MKKVRLMPLLIRRCYWCKNPTPFSLLFNSYYNHFKYKILVNFGSSLALFFSLMLKLCSNLMSSGHHILVDSNFSPNVLFHPLHLDSDSSHCIPCDKEANPINIILVPFCLFIFLNLGTVKNTFWWMFLINSYFRDTLNFKPHLPFVCQFL